MKSIITALIGIGILISIMFLWNELPSLSFQKKIDTDKVAGFFTAFGSLSTAFFTALIPLANAFSSTSQI